MQIKFKCKNCRST